MSAVFGGVVVWSLSHAGQFCYPMDCGLPGSSIYGIFQAGILEQVSVSFSRGSYQPRDEPTFPALAGGFFITEPPGKLTYLVSTSLIVGPSWATTKGHKRPHVHVQLQIMATFGSFGSFIFNQILISRGDLISQNTEQTVQRVLVYLLMPSHN